MTIFAKLEALRAREQMVTRAAIGALGLAALAMLGTLVHIDTGAGAHMRDVHIPADWFWTLPTFGKPYVAPADVGHGLGPIVEWLQLLLFGLLSFGALGAVMWAQREGKRQFVVPALIAFTLVGFAAPVPKVFVHGTAKVVSVQAAQRLLDTPPSGPFVLSPKAIAEQSAYIRAQIAYVNGDLASARALSTGIEPGALGSPIEAPYRLQFLQGQYKGRTTVCFIQGGCIREPERRFRFNVLAWVAGLSSFAALAFGALSLVLRQSLSRINMLTAAGHSNIPTRLPV